ncbi:MAG: NIPSNAP family protein [Planctomycetaceae bacterium]
MPLLVLAFVAAWIPAFLQAAEPGQAPAQPAREEPAGATRVYEFRTVRVAPAKLEAFHARLRDHQIPALARHGVVVQGVFVPVGENPDRIVHLLTAAESVAAMDAGWAALANDAAWLETLAATDRDGPLVLDGETELLVTTAWSPPFMPQVSATPRVFERRIYSCPDPAKHAALLRRFQDHTVALFTKHGMQNIVYWTPATPPASQHRLVYLLGHENEAAAKASFAAFRTDSDWVAARKESEERAGGSLTNAQKGVVSEFLTATDYSPLR